MTPPRAYGTLTSVGGRPALRFELDVPYPVERVWRAVSVPAELEQFFPAAAPWTPVTGEEIDLGGAVLTVTEASPPNLLEWTFAGQPQSFALSGGTTGCRLVFTHVIDDLPAAQTAAGWECYLARLEPHLAGGHRTETEAHENWRQIHDLYAEKFGVDPAPGRAWAAQNLGGAGG